MFDKKLGPNLPAKTFVHTVFFAAGWFLLACLPTTFFKTMGLALITGAGFFLGLSPLIPFLLGGMAFGVYAGLLRNLILTAFFLGVFFSLTRDRGLTWPIALRKKHEKFYLFAKEPVENSFVWALRNRLVPLIPFDDFNLGAGASKAGLLPYLGGSLTGLLPQILVFTCLGTAFGNMLRSGEFHAGVIGWGIPALVLLFIPVFYRHMEGWGSEQ